MKVFSFRNLVYLLVLALLYIEPAFGLGFAMAIPIVDLYNVDSFGLGKHPIHHPINYTATAIGEGVIQFGRALSAGTSNDQAKTISGVSKRFVGVSAYSVSASLLSEGKYSDKDVVGVIKTGYVSVYVEEAVNRGDAVRIRHTNHASDATLLAGQFAKTAEAGKTAVLSNAEWVKDAGSAGVGILYIGDNAVITADV
jgi:hypothetical protein